MIQYPQIDPVALQIGPLAIRWYGLAYLCGVLAALFFLKRDFKRLKLSDDQVMNLLTAVVLGIMLGGRIGYVLFYDLSYYLMHPSSILAFWQGGMSYHGGAIGALIGVMIFSIRSKVSWLEMLDVLGIGSTFGLFFGRVANFINGELYGRVTDVAWGMVFPGGGPSLRHPSQLYEAFFEGVVLFLILYGLKRSGKLKPGQLFSAYLIGYGVFRFFIEFVRQPDAQLGAVMGILSMGQVLCLVMIGFGLLFPMLVKKWARS